MCLDVLRVVAHLRVDYTVLVHAVMAFPEVSSFDPGHFELAQFEVLLALGAFCCLALTFVLLAHL